MSHASSRRGFAQPILQRRTFWFWTILLAGLLAIAIVAWRQLGNRQTATARTTTGPVYIEVLAGRVPAKAVGLKPGLNYLQMMPGADTGCMKAPSGWYLSEEEPDRYSDRPQPRAEAIRVWVNCHVDGVGVRSYEHSEFRPSSVRVINDTRYGVAITVYLAPN